MSEKEKIKNKVEIAEKRCSGCQQLKNECICIEGYHTLNNRMAHK